MTEPRRATMSDFLLFEKPDKPIHETTIQKNQKNFGERKRIKP